MIYENTIIGSEMNRPILTQSQPDDSNDKPAASNGPKSNFGRRKAYEDLSRTQWSTFNACKITYFSLMSTYTLTKQMVKPKRAVLAPQILLEVDSHGKNLF